MAKHWRGKKCRRTSAARFQRGIRRTGTFGDRRIARAEQETSGCWNRCSHLITTASHNVSGHQSASAADCGQDAADDCPCRHFDLGRKNPRLGSQTAERLVGEPIGRRPTTTKNGAYRQRTDQARTVAGPPPTRRVEQFEGIAYWVFAGKSFRGVPVAGAGGLSIRRWGGPGRRTQRFRPVIWALLRRPHRWRPGIGRHWNRRVPRNQAVKIFGKKTPPPSTKPCDREARRRAPACAPRKKNRAREYRTAVG